MSDPSRLPLPDGAYQVYPEGLVSAKAPGVKKIVPKKDFVIRMPLVWQGVLIIFLVLLAYLPSLRAGFIWDDDYYVTQNPTLHDLGGLCRIWFQIGAVPQYYPMVHTSFWLEYHLWNLNPLGYHLVNVLLHATAALLLWQVLRRLQVPGAWLAALLFALHPVMVESVAWVTERKNVLSAVFYFAAALAYLRFLARGNQARRWPWYLLALALFVAALLSKTVTCSWPAALWLVCWWKHGRVQRSDVLPLLPFLALGLGLGLLTAWIEKHYVGAEGTEWSLTLVDRGLIAGRALWFYAGKLVWPSPLTFIYPRWEINPTVWWQWLYPAGAVGMIAALWLGRNRLGRGPLVAVLFFAGTLGPALGFVNVYPMRYSFVADHFQYLASVGLLTLGAAGLVRLPRIVPAALVVGLGVLTWQQTAIYQNLETLWRDTLLKNPNSAMAHTNLGVWLGSQGRIEEAMAQYREALRIEPDAWDTLSDLGVALAAQGRWDEAVENFLKVNQLNPNSPDVLYNLGFALAAQGRWKEAIERYRQVLQLSPADTEALNNLAWILATCPDGRLRNGTEAIRLAEHACELTHHIEPVFLETLAAAYAEAGQFPEAVTAAEKAEQLAVHAGAKDLAEKTRLGLELYRAGQPYHQPALAK